MDQQQQQQQQWQNYQLSQMTAQPAARQVAGAQGMGAPPYQCALPPCPALAHMLSARQHRTQLMSARGTHEHT